MVGVINHFLTSGVAVPKSTGRFRKCCNNLLTLATLLLVNRP